MNRRLPLLVVRSASAASPAVPAKAGAVSVVAARPAVSEAGARASVRRSLRASSRLSRHAVVAAAVAPPPDPPPTPVIVVERSDGFGATGAGQNLDGKTWDNALGGEGSQTWQFLYGWGGQIRGAGGGGRIEFVQDGHRNARSSTKLITADEMGLAAEFRLNAGGDCSLYPRYQLSGGTGDNHNQSGFAAVRLKLRQGQTAKLRFYSGGTGVGGDGEDPSYYREVDLGGSALPAGQWCRAWVIVSDRPDALCYDVRIEDLDDEAVYLNASGESAHAKAAGCRLSELTGNAAYVAIRGLEGAGVALLDNFAVIRREWA